MLKVAKIAGALLLIGSAVSVQVTPAQAAPPPPEPAPVCPRHTGHIEPGRPLCVASPDDAKRVIVERGRVTVVDEETSRKVGAADSGYVEWSPNSDAFLIVDERGMDVLYFGLGEERLSRTRRLVPTAIGQYAKTFNCVGPEVRAYAWYSGWQDGDHIRFVVQEGAQSRGCPPRDPGAALIGVLVNPKTNRVDEVVSQARVTDEWCAPAARRPYSQCHVRPRNR